MLGGLVGKGYLGGGAGWEGIFGLGGLVGREFSAGGLVAGGPGCGGAEWNTADNTKKSQTLAEPPSCYLQAELYGTSTPVALPCARAGARFSG